MSSFDPFLSTEYKKNLKDDNFNDPEPKLSKKTDSEFLSEILCSCFSGTSK